MRFFIKNFFSKCDQIRRKLRIWSHLLKKSLMENFIFCAVPLAIWVTTSSCLNVVPCFLGRIVENIEWNTVRTL